MKKERNIYLKLNKVNEVINIIEQLQIAEFDSIKLDSSEAVGHITAVDIYANFSVPHYNAAAMDGIATRADLTFGASETNPKSLPNKKYIPIDTGQPIPDNNDVVIPEEEVRFDENGNAIIINAVHPWQNIRIIGEDIVKEELLIPKNTLISENAIPLLLAGGVWKVHVKKPPKVLIIPTGNEVVKPPIQKLKDGMIIDYDSSLISKLIKKWGCQYKIMDVISDDPVLLKNTILKNINDYDFLCIIAGSSAGRRDFTSNVLEEIGHLLVHGVKMMPGKPFSLATVMNKAIFGIPGFPASAYFSTLLFVKRYVERLLSISIKEDTIRCKLSQNVPSRLGYDELIRVSVAEINNEIKAIPLKRGASVFKSIYESNGYFVIPENSEGFPIEKEINVHLNSNNFDSAMNILFVGSNDISIDFLKSLLKELKPYFNLISLNKGSMGGLVSLKNMETHFAPTHLLNPETGNYNISYIKGIFGKGKIALMAVAERNQGIIVKKGNPLNIQGIEDIPKGQFINRQKGSGTRILFDYLLENKSIDKGLIKGYDFELYTHMSICNFIQKGYADCGIGIKSASDSFGLDFIPIGKEEYELAFYKDFLNDEKFNTIRYIINSKSFKDKLKEAGGYDTTITGRIRKV